MGPFVSHSPRQLLVLVILAASLLAAAGAALALGPPAGARVGAGDFVWERTPDRTPDISNGLYLLAAGPSGSAYAAGMRDSADQSQNWLVKYLPSGRRAWSRAWGSTGGDSSTRNQVAALAVDRSGNAYVVACHRDGLDWSTALVKYGADGTLKWESAAPTNTYRSEPTCALGVDAAGTVYLAGSTDHSGTLDGYVARYRPSDGERTSLSWYEAAGADVLLDLAVTPSGDCYACGYTVALGQLDGLLVKWVAGEVSWARTWHAATDGGEQWARVFASGSGDVCVAGSADGGTAAIAAARYDASGSLLWDDVWDSVSAFDDEFEDAALARDGSLWVAGYTHLARIGKPRGEVVRWTAAGKRVFAKLVGTTARPVRLDAVVCDGTGNAYLVGRVKSSAGGTDPLAAKFSPRGGVLWQSSVALPGKNLDYLDNVVLGGPGFLNASGGSVGADVGRALLARIKR